MPTKKTKLTNEQAEATFEQLLSGNDATECDENCEVDPNIVTINIDNKDYTINLQKPLPKELFKQNFKWQWYIPSNVVRAIMQAVWLVPWFKTMEFKEAWTELMLVTSKVWIWPVQWTATDIYPLKWFSRACVWNSARVVMLAIKDALRYLYKCFEWEYASEDDDSSTSAESVVWDVFKNDWDSELFSMFKWKILNAVTQSDLTSVWWAIKDAADKLSETQKETLRDMFNKKLNNFK